MTDAEIAPTTAPGVVPAAPAALAGGLLVPAQGSGPEDTRRHNLSTILTAVHHRPGVTRAELTRLTGLNRSTVLKVVAELVEGALVHEVSPSEHAGRGRPSSHVYPARDVAALAVYPDLDAVTVGVIGLGGALLGRLRRPTEGRARPEQIVSLVSQLASDVIAQLPEPVVIVGVGCAVPGLVRAADGVVVDAPHMDWHDVPFGAMLSDALGLPVQVRNDARIATVAEAVFGAGRGVADLVYLNGSYSGIGGGAITGGVTLRGRDGYGGEFGHTRVDGGRERCHCGRTGCLETEVNLRRLLAALGRDDVDLSELDDELDAAQGRPGVEQEIDRQIGILAGAIGDLASVFNPSMVVLGGALGSLWSAAPDRLAAAVAADSFAPMSGDLTIVRAELGSRVHLVGAAEIFMLAYLRDPAQLAERVARLRQEA
ncbi:ROK family transcriptional regulator [Demequina capsici]|uniref:ROK family transcriptional regulator n=1 Tax=Demequina capsici TaxID=3075620 RepID=A0AA96JCI5_9MICO|nr:ROK family transcriptional regulator [Demequina sp. OYTSA14]WNM23669.1 ROK family transcriptional regulator [Demequina sp. OYTSA14]